MRTGLLGFLVLAGFVMVALGAPATDRLEVPGARMVAPGSIAANNEMIAVSAQCGERYQQVTVIDPKQRVMSVYHVELTSGKIALRSVRNIQWDLQMTEFNGVNPSPREIQALLDPR